MSARSVIRDLRFFVQPRPYAMAHKFAYHTEAIGLHQFLHGRANIAHGVSHPGRLNAPIQ